MAHPVTQDLFRARLFDAAQPVPEGLLDGAGRPAGRRFAVYRNNVAVSLRAALETGFPAVRSLIGAENFAYAAGLYLRRDLPETPILSQYGAGFPAFLEAQAPLQRWGYLGDVARLELALRRAYHAGDATPIDPQALRMDEAALMAARFTLAPAVQIMRSRWPIHAIRAFALGESRDKPHAEAEDVIVMRPEFDPVLRVLPRGGADFVAALQAGGPFADALDAAGEDFDLPACLTLLLEGGALIALKSGD